MPYIIGCRNPVFLSSWTRFKKISKKFKKPIDRLYRKGYIVSASNKTESERKKKGEKKKFFEN